MAEHVATEVLTRVATSESTKASFGPFQSKGEMPLDSLVAQLVHRPHRLARGRG